MVARWMTILAIGAGGVAIGARVASAETGSGVAAESGAAAGPGTVGKAQAKASTGAKEDPMRLRARIEAGLDRWCRWLSGYLYNVPGTDLYTLNPTRGTGRGPYRDVAGNAFAAAAAGYWLGRNEVDEATARPLRGLIKLSLGTHAAVGTIDRPDVSMWGATRSVSDDWHADLFAAAQGMLLVPDGLAGEQREQMAAILRWEADKQVEYGIDKGRRSWPGLEAKSTCGESNAWSAALLQVARMRLAAAERDEAWREAAIEYSLNAICTPADAASEEVVGGRPLRERVKGANFHPGGIQEHHGFYHPGYMGWPLAYEALAYVCDEQLPEGRRNPEVYLHNWKRVFDRLKQSTFSNGRFIHCAGDDWITYGYGNTQFFLAMLFGAARFGDADAALMADEWLKLVEYQQELGGGSVLRARMGTFERLRMNDFAWYEAQEGCVLAQALWMLEHMDGVVFPAPATAAEYDRRNGGTYVEPGAKLSWHRDEHRFASASWRSAFGVWQFVVQPVDLPHLLKFNYNGMGMIELPATERRLEVRWSGMDRLEGGGFGAIGLLERESKKVTVGEPVFPLVRQYQAMAALPGGLTVLVDWCQAADQIWILREGGLGLRLAADLFNGKAVRLAVDGREQAYGQAECREVWHDLGSRSVTIEGRMTIRALAGEGTFQLLRKRARSADRSEPLDPLDHHGEEESLVAHELYFGPAGYERPRIVGPGVWFRRQVLVFRCDPAGRRDSVTGTVSGEFPCMAVELPGAGYTVGMNFDEGERSVETSRGRVVVPGRSVRVVEGAKDH